MGVGALDSLAKSDDEVLSKYFGIGGEGEEEEEETGGVGGEAGEEEEEEEEETTYSFQGRTLNEEEMQRAVAALDWANSLSPEQTKLYNSLGTGQSVVVPVEQYSELMQKQQAPVVTSVLPEEQEDYVDPRAARDIAELRESVGSLTQAAQQSAQSNAEDRRTRNLQGIQNAREDIKSRYELEDAEVLALEQRLQAHNILDGLVQGAGGDVRAGTLKGFELVYRSDPVFQKREMDRLLENANDEEKTRRKRKQKASSVGSKGGNTSRQPPPPKGRQEVHQAIASMIRESQTG